MRIFPRCGQSRLLRRWQRRVRPSWLRVAVSVLSTAMMLQACGFQPLYGGGEAGVTRSQLATIRIAPIRERAGQQLHNALRDRLNPLGQPTEPIYVLDVQLDERTNKLGFRKDQTATRAELILNATFEITDKRTGERVLRDRHTVTNSYNILDSEFATIAARADARERGIDVMADAIRLRVANFLARRQAASLDGTATLKALAKTATS